MKGSIKITPTVSVSKLFSYKSSSLNRISTENIIFLLTNFAVSVFLFWIPKRFIKLVQFEEYVS